MSGAALLGGSTCHCLHLYCLPPHIRANRERAELFRGGLEKDTKHEVMSESRPFEGRGATFRERIENAQSTAGGIEN